MFEFGVFCSTFELLTTFIVCGLNINCIGGGGGGGIPDTAPEFFPPINTILPSSFEESEKLDFTKGLWHLVLSGKHILDLGTSGLENGLLLVVKPIEFLRSIAGLEN